MQNENELFPAQKYQWSALKPLQIGRYAEYYVKMECALHDFDIYTPEIDDKGIDFLIRNEHGEHFDIQVKSARRMNYIFIQAEKLILRPNLLVAAVYFFNGRVPDVFLIPSTAWLQPNKRFVYRGFEGKKSKAEYGISVSRDTYDQLLEYSADKALTELKAFSAIPAISQSLPSA